MKTHAGRRAPKIKKQSVAVNNDERRWFEKCGLSAARRMVRGLKVRPKPRIDAEMAAEANGRIGGDVAALATDPTRNADRLSVGVRQQAQGLHVSLSEDFAGAGASPDKLDEGFSMRST